MCARSRISFPLPRKVLCYRLVKGRLLLLYQVQDNVKCVSHLATFNVGEVVNVATRATSEVTESVCVQPCGYLAVFLEVRLRQTGVYFLYYRVVPVLLVFVDV